MGKLWENDNIERDSPSKIICPKLFFQACQLTVADILSAFPFYSSAFAGFESLVNTKGQYF